MADRHLTKHGGTPAGEHNPLAMAILYRLRRDALMIVSNMNRGRDLPSVEVMKRRLVFVQGQLCAAAVADPRLPNQLKSALVQFQGATVHDNIEDRRGSRRREPRSARGVA